MNVCACVNMSLVHLLDKLISARDVPSLLAANDEINAILSDNILSLNSKHVQKWKISSILAKIEKKMHQKLYQFSPLKNRSALIIGAGPSGLRTAIEFALLGSRVFVVEKRDTFSRNNVIHLWPSIIYDLKDLGAKKIYSRFCVGSIDHISIRELQLILLKICLILGVKFYKASNFLNLDQSFYAQFCPQNDFLSSIQFDFIIGADGKRNTLKEYFPRKEFRGRLAIAITANFVNNRTESEARCEEISGISYIYNQQWFQSLYQETGIKLENICYYKDETHYFVMTAQKTSLLARGVLKHDFADTQKLLAPENVSRDALLQYARDAASWSSRLPSLQFALNSHAGPDVALFDFTSQYAATNASRVKRVHNKHVLLLLVGDSLLEPFWPTGSGCGRGFLSALDAAWMAREWVSRVHDEDDVDTMLDVIAERESIYRLLAQTTPENLNRDFSQWSVSPSTRYSNWSQKSRTLLPHQVKHLLFDTIDAPNKESISMAAKRARRATIAVTQETIQHETIRNPPPPLRSSNIDRKQDWLLGETTIEHRPSNPYSLNDRVRDLESKLTQSRGLHVDRAKQKSQEILARADHLEHVVLKPTEFAPKLNNVGKIDQQDFNVRCWNTNKSYVPPREPEVPRPSSLMASRVEQMETHLIQANEEQIKPTRDHMSRDWISQISDELIQRMNSVTTTKPSSKSSSIERPKCVRCNGDVTVMERILVQGDTLHRSCLTCRHCGVTLRLAEVRSNNTDYTCCVCAANNNNNVSRDLFRAKHEFLAHVQQLDLRERVEFEFQKSVETNNQQKTQETQVNDDEQQWSQDDEEDSDDQDDEDDDDDDDDNDNDEVDDEEEDEWETDDEESSEQESSEKSIEKEENNLVPSICVTLDTPRPSPRPPLVYSGSFTEKLLRSRSQPSLLRMRQMRTTDAAIRDDHQDVVPFIEDVALIESHFSPCRAQKAPVVTMEDEFNF